MQTTQNNMEMCNNQICKFKCGQCHKSKFVLKKVSDQQHHGFACEECWINIEKRSRHSWCQIG